MLTVMQIIKTQKEGAFFESVFKKANITCVKALPSFQVYVQMLQYDPHIVIMELPKSPNFHLKFLEVIKSNCEIKQIPFILYGPRLQPELLPKIKNLGVASYMTRPIDMRRMAAEIIKVVGTRTDGVAGTNRNQSKDISAAGEKNQMSRDELEKLFNPSIKKSEKLKIMISHVGELLAFPATVANVLRVTQSDKSGANDLAKVIRSDPSVSAEILKVSNSVFFASRNKRIVDVRDAIIRIGFAQTKNIAMSVAAFSSIKKARNFETGFAHNEYWFHSLAVALIAEKIAKKTKVVAQEEAFITGLLHDLGLLLYNEYFNRLFLVVLDRAVSNGIRFFDCEREVLGLSHNDLMAALLEKWQFPERLGDSLLGLYTAGVYSEEIYKNNPLTALISVAETIAKSLQIGRETDCCVEPVPPEMVKRFGFVYGIQKAFMDELYNDLNMFNSFLKIDDRRFPTQTAYIEHAEKVQIAVLQPPDEAFSPVATYLGSQNYAITVTDSLEEALEIGEKKHVLLLPSVTGGQKDLLQKCSELDMRRFRPDDDESTETCSSKWVAFDTSKELSNADFSDHNIIANYPVDLRNLDVVVAGLLNDADMKSSVNEMGALCPRVQVNLKGEKINKLHTLIAFSKVDKRKHFRQLLLETRHDFIEETTDGVKATNVARTTEKELHLVILDMNIGFQDCPTTVRKIKELPTHKRVRFIITGDAPGDMDNFKAMKIEKALYIPSDCSKNHFQKTLVELGLE